MPAPRARRSSASAARRASPRCSTRSVACSSLTGVTLLHRGAFGLGGRGVSRAAPKTAESAGAADPSRRPPRARAPGGRGRPARSEDPRRVRRRARGCDRRRGALGRGPDGQLARRGTRRTGGIARVDGPRAGRNCRTAPALPRRTRGSGGGASDVRRSADRLALLGADLVDLGRIESGELVVRADDVSLAEVLAAAVGDTCVESGRVEVEAAHPAVRER